MTDVVVPEIREIARPDSGELLSKDDPAGCARAIDEIRELEWRLRQVKKWLTEALVEESGRQGSKTLRFDGMTVTLGASTVTEWDTTELLKLLDLGLPEARYNALVTEEVSYKVSASEAKRIAAANPEYAAVIEQAKTVREKDPSATIKQE